MKKLITAFTLTTILFSCGNDAGKGKFTLTGTLKGTKDQRIFLDEVFFSERKNPEVLDTAEIRDGKFTLSAIGTEEGIYRLRIEGSQNAYIFINESNDISFTGDIDNNNLN